MKECACYLDLIGSIQKFLSTFLTAIFWFSDSSFFL
jgi:hypothetical protein